MSVLFPILMIFGGWGCVFLVSSAGGGHGAACGAGKLVIITITGIS